MRYITLLCLTFVLPQAVGAKDFQTRQWKTNNGTQVVFHQAMEVPMLDINIAFAAGSAYDGEYHGLSALTTDLINQGNAGLDASTVADRLANTGAQFSNNTSRDMAILSLKTLTSSDALDKAVDVFSLIVGQPDFLAQAFAREKDQQLMAIAQAQESPNVVANQTFFKALYQNHPYAHPILGERETVDKLTVEDVRGFYQQFFVSNNAVLVMVGAISETKAHQIAETLTQKLKKGEPADPVPEADRLNEALDLEVPFPSSQTAIRIGELGITHRNDAYFPLLVGNYTLGGGSLVSRLALELRAKRGLTYGVSSQFAPMPGKGPFLISLATRSEQANTAIDLTRKTLSEFVHTGPSKAELKAAKNYLTGSFPLSLASNSNIAGMLLKIAFYHLPDNYLDTYIDNVNAVSTKQIQIAFQKEVHPEKLLQVRVGPM